MTLLDHLHAAHREADAGDPATAWAISYAIQMHIRAGQMSRDQCISFAEEALEREQRRRVA